ncbi:MAG: carboxymuconolactone decarboxylase family protein [Solirubrobacteraceae bacterium]
MPDQTPTKEQILERMSATLGTIPAALEKSLTADPRMIFEQVRSSAWAMPPEDGALDERTRTLIYFAVALATSNQACTLAMLGKANTLEIPDAELLEAFHIARFAMATQVLGNAEPLFDHINQRSALPGEGEQL